MPDPSTIDAAERERYVYRELVRCPKCDQAEHRVYGKDPSAEPGSLTQYARCLNPECGHKFKIVWE